MKKVVVFTLFLSFFFCTIRAQTITKQNIYFDSDQHTLKQEFREQLADIKNQSDAFNESIIKIVGHTDQEGGDSYNMKLSRKRAEEVKKALVNTGIPEDRIELSFKGESELLFDQLDKISKQKNRRVTLIMEGFTYNNPTELVTQVEHENNTVVTVSNKETSEIILNQGTEVKIPENAFCNLDGTPIQDDMVKVEFKEAFEYTSMVDEMLFTQTEGRLLETGGMIQIEATSNGVPLKLKDGKSIELLFPEQEFKEGMELFTGNEDEEGIIWDETGESIGNEKSNDLPDIKVDLAPLLELTVGDSKLEPLVFDPMPAYPHPARISYPPYRENYTEEGYTEAVAKYEAVMKAHEADKIDRPERVAVWVEEAKRRRDILREYKKAYAKTQLIKKVKLSLQRLEKDQGRVCHDKLVNVLFRFMDDEVGQINYNDWHYSKLAFESNVVEASKEIALEFPTFRYYKVRHFFPELEEAIMEVRARILDKKYELGYVDEALMSRYVVQTSKLGWINCDRFIELAKDEKTNLEFARLSYDDKFYMIFKGIKSMIRPTPKEGKVVFKGVPKGEEVRIIAVHMEDDNVRMAAHDFVIDENSVSTLTYRPAGIKELRKALEI